MISPSYLAEYGFMHFQFSAQKTHKKQKHKNNNAFSRGFITSLYFIFRPCGQQTLSDFQAFKNVFVSNSSSSCNRRALHPHPPFYRQKQKYTHHPSYRHWKNASPGWRPYWAWLLAEAPRLLPTLTPALTFSADSLRKKHPLSLCGGESNWGAFSI